MDCEVYSGDALSKEQKRLGVLKQLSNGSCLVDWIRKDRTETQFVRKEDHTAFFVEENPFFDCPESEILNELVSDGLLSVEVSTWMNGRFENPHYNQRDFRLTDKGRDHLTDHTAKN